MVAVFVVDSQLRCAFINPVAEVLTGLSMAEARHRPFAKVIFPANPSDFEQTRLARALEAGGGEGEETLPDRTGARRSFAFRVVPLGGELAGGRVIELTDLGGETGTGRALQEGERRLRLALVAGRMGTWRLDVRTGKQQWDDTQYRLFGVDPAVRPTRELFLSLVHPDDRSKVEFDPETLPTGTYLDSEFRIIRPDGRIRWMAANAVAYGDPGSASVEMIGVNRDITAQKEGEVALRISEEQHRLAIEANEIGTWDHDMLTGEHRWSAQYRRLWGLPADSPADPELVRPLVDRADWQMRLRHWADAEAGSGRISLEHPIRRADDGARRWCMFSGQIFFDEDYRRPIRSVGIMMDVTGRREAEERQRLVVRELNHRVKNTLAVVQAVVSQTIRLSPRPSEAFERIQARLMAMARTHESLNASEWRGTSLLELLKGELDSYATEDAGRISLDGPLVVLDSDSALALGLIFHELATNAARHGSLSADGGHLDVRWTVRDDGPGSPQATLTWVESGGPPVRAPRKTGFGSRLIEGSARGSLGGSIEAVYAAAGFRCTLMFDVKPPA